MVTWARFRRSRPHWQVVAWLLLPPLPLFLLARSVERGHRGRAWTAFAVASVVWLALVVPPTMRPTPATTTSTTGATAPTRTGGTDAGLLDGLRIEPEGSAVGYRRDLFGGGWIDGDGDGCDTRCEVLEAERRPDGTWHSAYDGYTTPSPDELQIDHVVALAEAWRSGAATWSPSQRVAFANDLTHPGALIAVTAATNQSKSDRDPASWQPPDRSAWCQYVRDWIATKRAWSLAADEAEARALTNMHRAAC